MAASKPSAEQLITENIDVWSSAIKKRGSQGRGSSKKIILYGINKLRELILELAVRGLLVPQDTSDEPATVLLEKIAAEKEQLIADGEIKKQKPFAEIRDEEKEFDLPIGWSWVKLGDLVEMYNGRAFKSSEWVQSGIPIVRIQNLNSPLAEFNYFDGDLADHNRINNGSFLISWSGTPGTSFGAFIWNRGEAALNQHINNCIFNYKNMNLSFMQLAVNGCMNHFISMAQGAVGLKHVTKGTLNNAIMGFPPEAEQPRIVAKVNELMALCDQLEQQTESSLSAHQTLVETLLNTLLTAAQTTGTKESSSQSNSNQESSFDQAWNRIAQHFDVLFTTEHSIDQLKQTILQLAVMGKLVPQDPNDEPASVLLEKGSKARDLWLLDNLDDNPECKTMLKKLKKLDKPKEPFPIPSTWACAHLIQVSSLLVDCHNKTAPYEDDGIPIIRTTNIREREFKFAGMKYVNEDTYNYWSRRCPPAPGDIMFTREAPMGEGAIIPEGVKWCLGQRTMLIRPLHDFVSKEYLLLALTEPHLLERASEHAVGLTVKHLRVGDVERLNIPIPPLEEQRRIASRVSELMALCDTLKKCISESQATQLYLADAMAEKALT
jgi:type I restriction enzyme S subunit